MKVTKYKPKRHLIDVKLKLCHPIIFSQHGPVLMRWIFVFNFQNNTTQNIQQIQTLLAKKDGIIQNLEKRLQESEGLVRQLEQQGRDNEEKVMHELAVKIKTAEGFQLKLEESKQQLEDRNKTIEGLMDRLDAQKRLIESRDQVIDQLKAMKNLDSGADELVGTLREQLEAMNGRVEKAVDEADRAKREVSALKKELDEKRELIAAAEKVRDY